MPGAAEHVRTCCVLVLWHTDRRGRSQDVRVVTKVYTATLDETASSVRNKFIQSEY